MKHLSNSEKNKIIIAAINKYFTLPHKEGLCIREHRINTTDIRMMAVLGTNFQEEYVIAHIVALKNYIMDKCNEHH
ncbi:Uncharacterised protein [Escherichia coli]|uniref:hypothetical protein n=1 Tax=Escherichia coli TaxID=562 RepID=UPI001A42A4E1|nr:hypothetical protein [Escherichia coli]WPK19765.1 hypothetical protein [Salmonella phage SD-1_S14]VVZ32143.1 Uncharacterised protein [Escherichia coli]VVZ33277.1 Uncharacterised protein [Escherichia coli]VWN20605.1 Uncharacterised protein [Escherichia coli]